MYLWPYINIRVFFNTEFDDNWTIYDATEILDECEIISDLNPLNWSVKFNNYTSSWKGFLV